MGLTAKTEVKFKDGSVAILELSLGSCGCPAFVREQGERAQGEEEISPHVLENYERPRLAAIRWLQLNAERPGENWAVHLDGHHVVGVER